MSDGEATGAARRAELVEVARVVRARGLHGELIVRSHAEDPELLLAQSQVVLDGGPGAIPHRVLERRPLHRQRDGRWLLVLHLAGIAARAQAERWIGAALQIPAAALEAARGGDLYWRDLIGLECVGPDGELLGHLREIWPRPAQDLLVVEGPDGAQLLVPAVEQLLRRVDLAAGRIWLELPEAAGFAR
jgi:16S rRNA processing protein RimM